MILLSEYKASRHKSAGTAYLKKMEDAVRLLGIEVINFDKRNLESLEEILQYKRNLKQKEKVFWLGFVPKYEDYQFVYETLGKRNLELINNPKQFAKSEYFDQFYPFIKDYSIESGIATSFKEAKEIATKLAYPVFLKGTIQSLKKFGWKNCVATSETELEEIFNKLKFENEFSLGKVIIRKFVELKYNEIGGNGIPKAHEYRFFVLNGEILDYSYYWNGENPFNLSIIELEHLKKTVITVAKSVQVPFISVDVGETKNEGWKVIEIGDGQFSDIRNISPLKIWNYINANHGLKNSKNDYISSILKGFNN